MTLAWISLIALLIVILVSCTTRLNAGFLSIVFAFIIGVYLRPLFGTEDKDPLKTVLAGFPSDLFLTLVGVTLLFTQAQVNGTLDQLARWAVRGCRGNVGLMPIMFFGLALGLGSIGAGNIAAAALMAPMAMRVADRAGIPSFLMILMVAHGANAAALSPFSPTGVIAGKLMSQMGLGGYEWHTYFNNLIANLTVAFGGYFLFGGWRLFSRTYVERDEKAAAVVGAPATPFEDSGRATPFQPRHAVTLAIIAALVLAVIFFKVNVGMGAFLGACILTLLRMTDDKQAILRMPWNVMLMVCGVTVLTAMLEKTGGMDLFTTLLASISTEETATGTIAFVTGVVSVYSSTSGVVLPTFLPSVPGLVQKLGGGDPFAIASSIIVGGHLVDVSPLSTIGALCIASASASEDRRVLFNQVLAWGLSMAVVGAVLCYVFFGLL